MTHYLVPPNRNIRVPLTRHACRRLADGGLPFGLIKFHKFVVGLNEYKSLKCCSKMPLKPPNTYIKPL